MKAGEDRFWVTLVVVAAATAVALDYDVNARNSAGLTQLHFAASSGNIQLAQDLLRNGALIDAQSKAGNTPLHVACEEGQVQMLRLLLQARAMLESRAAMGITPLYLAAQKNQPGVVRALLQSRAAVDGATDSGHTPLHAAAMLGNVEVGRILVNHQGTVDALTQTGATPLHLAAEKNQHDSKMTRMLLDSSASVDIQDSTGCTPLHLAAHAGSAKIVRSLLEYGAAVNKTSSQELTALDMVAYGTPPDPKALDCSVEVASLSTIAVLASFSGSASIVHPWNGQTALHVMAYLGLDSLVPPEATKDCRFHLQRGDGIEARLTSAFVPKQGRAHLQAYETAIRLAPTSVTVAAYLRLGAARARLKASIEKRAGRSQHNERSSADQEDQVAQQNEALMLDAFRNAWQLQPEGYMSEEEYVREKAELALVGWLGEDTKSRREASDLAVSWETPVQQPAAMRQALNLWRRQGVVVFTGLLNESTVLKLRQATNDVLADEIDVAKTGAVDRTRNIQAAHGRTLRALQVVRCAEALAVISAELAPFLNAALGDASQLLLEIAAYRAAPGAESQGWHRDNPVRDLRMMSMQIALSDTHAEQGALEVQPGTHGASQEARPHAAVTAAVVQGSVLFYSPFLLHRGRANTLHSDRLAVTGTLLGEGGLVPNGIPLAVRPEDAGRWWLFNGALHDKLA